MISRWNLLLLCNLLVFGATGQRNVKEEVYLHLNSADLLVGQTLHYSAFVRSQATGKLSRLSKFLYVELIDDEGTAIHQAKLSVVDGRGSGQYFVPSLLKTGIYHLTAYTRWMRNWGEYFHTSLHITNPYEELEPKDDQQTLSVAYFPQDDQIIPDTENELTVYVTQGRKPVQIKGRVIAAGDDQAIAFASNREGLARIQYTPNASTKHQIILEGSNGFEFFDLPAPCQNCASLNVEEVDEQLVFDLRACPDFVKERLRLEIHSAQSPLLSEDWADNQKIRIPSARLPKATLRALLLQRQDTLSEVVFVNGDLPQVDARPTPAVSVGTREYVTREYPMAAGTSASISIKRVDDVFLSSVDLTAHAFLGRVHNTLDIRQVSSTNLSHLQRTSRWSKSIIDGEEVRLLPEFRSDLVEGIITDLQGNPESDLSIALSIPSRPYQLRIAQSNANGRFVLDYESDIRMDRGIFHVFENVRQRVISDEAQVDMSLEEQIPTNIDLTTMDVNEKYRLHILDEFYAGYPDDLPATPLLFDSLKVRSYINRSIYNQIENAYYDNASDTLLMGIPQIYGFQSYRLDDFTRFPTIRDTFIEIIPYVGVSKNEQNYRINLRTETDFEHRQVSGESILMIDGVLVDSEAVFNISPYLVERIDVLGKKYFFGEKMFDGIIALHTYGGDAWDTPSKSRQITLTPTQPLKTIEGFPAPDVGHHADYRTQLSWQPARTVPTNGKLAVSFHTSQVPGRYQVEIQGVTPSGEPITIRESFEVGSQVPEN